MLHCPMLEGAGSNLTSLNNYPIVSKMCFELKHDYAKSLVKGQIAQT